MDSLNASLEAEQKAKGEALRIKKKIEGDINELEIALDHSNKVYTNIYLKLDPIIILTRGNTKIHCRKKLPKHRKYIIYIL